MYWLQKFGDFGLRWFCVGCAKDIPQAKMTYSALVWISEGSASAAPRTDSKNVYFVPLEKVMRRLRRGQISKMWCPVLVWNSDVSASAAPRSDTKNYVFCILHPCVFHWYEKVLHRLRRGQISKCISLIWSSSHFDPPKNVFTTLLRVWLDRHRLHRGRVTFQKT